MPSPIPPQHDHDAAAPDPGGAERVVELRLPAGYAGPAMHVHAAYDEVFEVLEGMPTLIVGGERHAMLPGETVRVRGGVPHTFANTADLPARVVVTAARAGGCRLDVSLDA